MKINISKENVVGFFCKGLINGKSAQREKLKFFTLQLFIFAGISFKTF